MKRQKYYVFATDRKRHRFLRFLRVTAIVLLAMIVLGALAAVVVKNRVHLETQRITVSDLSPELNSYSILHLSDLHGAELGRDQAAIRSAVSNTTYSCVLMTGDMLGPEGQFEPLMKLLDVLSTDPTVDKLYLPGDEDGDYLDYYGHGTSTALTLWAEQLTERGFTILDRPYLVTRNKGKARLWFVPEELFTMDADRELAEWRDKVQRQEGSEASKRVARYQLDRWTEIAASRKEINQHPGDTVIAVTHTPLTEAYSRVTTKDRQSSPGFSLQHASLILAGHYCGGQWRIPFGPAIYVPDRGWFPSDESLTGLGWAGSTRQYISPGLGASRIYPMPAFRLYNPPVITKLILTNSAAN